MQGVAVEFFEQKQTGPNKELQKERARAHDKLARLREQCGQAEQINIVRAKIAATGREMRRRTRKHYLAERQRLTDELHDMMRKNNTYHTHRLSRRLAKTGIGTKHRRCGLLPKYLPGTDEISDGITAKGTKGGPGVE